MIDFLKLTNKLKKTGLRQNTVSDIRSSSSVAIYPFIFSYSLSEEFHKERLRVLAKVHPEAVFPETVVNHPSNLTITVKKHGDIANLMI